MKGEGENLRQLGIVLARRRRVLNRAVTDFLPTAIELRETDLGPAIVAVDAAGDYAGIRVPDAVVSVLGQIVAESRDQLLEAWHQYHRDRGGEVLFWDLVKLSQAIVAFGPQAELMPLARFPTVDSVFHNAWQAHAMVVAQRAELAPILVPTRPPSRTPDVRLGARNDQGVEIKTVLKTFTAELYSDGIRMTPGQIAALRVNLEGKARDGYKQSGANGAVILPVWCDVAGLFLDAATPRTSPSAVTFDARSLTLAFCGRNGVDQFAVFSADAYGAFLTELEGRMSRILVPRGIKFTRHVSVVRGTKYLPIGRHLALTDRTLGQ